MMAYKMVQNYLVSGNNVNVLHTFQVNNYMFMYLMDILHFVSIQTVIYFVPVLQYPHGIVL